MKRYYIEVRVYRSVNKLGQDLQNYVADKYDRCIIDSDTNLDAMIADIQSQMISLSQNYNRMNPIKLLKKQIEDGYWVGVRPENVFNDNYVFIMTVTKIRKTYAVGMIKKGGLQ